MWPVLTIYGSYCLYIFCKYIWLVMRLNGGTLADIDTNKFSTLPPHAGVTSCLECTMLGSSPTNHTNPNPQDYREYPGPSLVHRPSHHPAFDHLQVCKDGAMDGGKALALYIHAAWVYKARITRLPWDI